MSTTTNLSTLKINYLTQAQYETALANNQINENELYFTPDSDTIASTTATLSTSSWSNNTQTVTVTGVTASNNVIISPAPASMEDYTAAGIRCTAQAASSLTFECDTVPTDAVTVNVLVLS